MIFGKIETVITMKIYDKDGNFVGEKAKYIYKTTLTWFDVIVGLSAAFIIFTQTYGWMV